MLIAIVIYFHNDGEKNFMKGAGSERKKNTSDLSVEQITKIKKTIVKKKING